MPSDARARAASLRSTIPPAEIEAREVAGRLCLRGGVFPAIEAGPTAGAQPPGGWFHLARGGRHPGMHSANIAYHVRQIRRCYEEWLGEAGPDAPCISQPKRR